MDREEVKVAMKREMKLEIPAERRIEEIL